MRVERVLDVLRLTHGRVIAQQVGGAGAKQRGALGQSRGDNKQLACGETPGESRGVRGRAEVKGQPQGKKRDGDESGQPQTIGQAALAQMPAVTVPCVIIEASRTKRATLSALVRMSPSTVALAPLGKPNQGERLR